MKVRFTKQAEASVTYLGRYQVETGTVLENVSDEDGNFLLQTGAFEVLDTKAAKDDTRDKKSSSASDSSSSSKETKKDSK